MKIFHRLIIAFRIPPQMNQLLANDDGMMDILHRSTHLLYLNAKTHLSLCIDAYTMKILHRVHIALKG